MAKRSKSSTPTASTEPVLSGKHSVEAEVLGKKPCVFLRIPYRRAHIILMLDRAWLKRGFGQAKKLQVLVDYDTVKMTSRGWKAKVKIEKEIERDETVET